MSNDKETTVSLLQSSADEILPSENSTVVASANDATTSEASVAASDANIHKNAKNDQELPHLLEPIQPDKELADEMKNTLLYNQSRVATESINSKSTNNSPRSVHRYTGCLTSVPKKLRYEERSNSTGKLYQSDRRVSFPENDSELVTGYLEPADPWASVKPIACVSELAELYRESCEKHNAKPIDAIIKHLDTLDLSTQTRRPVLNLREQNLTAESCEALEEVLKRVQYKLIDLTRCGLDDISASALFDMIEYYEAANEIDISENINIANRGWQACINMIKRSNALQTLATRCTRLTETNAIHLGKAMLNASLHTLKLEHCGLSGGPIQSLCNYLRRNTVLKELWLAHNDLTKDDAHFIGVLLKANFHLQFLDISNNRIEDLGVLRLTEALIGQAEHFKSLQETLTSSTSTSSTSKEDKFSIISLELEKLHKISKSPIPGTPTTTATAVPITPTAATASSMPAAVSTTTATVIAAADIATTTETISPSKPPSGRSILETLLETQKQNELIQNQTAEKQSLELNDNLLDTIMEKGINNNSIEDLRMSPDVQEKSTQSDEIELKIIEDSDLNKSSDDLISFSDIEEQTTASPIASDISHDPPPLVDNNNRDIFFQDLLPAKNISQESDETPTFTTSNDQDQKSYDINENNSICNLSNSLDLSPSDLITLTDDTDTKSDGSLKSSASVQQSILDLDDGGDDGNFNRDNEKSNDLEATIVQIASKNEDTETEKEEEAKTIDRETLINTSNLSNIVIDKPTEKLPMIPISTFDEEKTKLPHSPNILKSSDLPLTPDSSQSLDTSCDFSSVFQPVIGPERSFSSESLNSETSIDSNDSKSSIKLTEAKFSKNGTLERQQTIAQTLAPPATAPCGLQVLILWNNEITRDSSKTLSDLIAATTTLEILNIGRNLLSNVFIGNVSASLKLNKSLTSLGLQGAHLTCTGIRQLAEILEFGGNATLQRIDLRDNHVQVAGLTALNDALKSNKSITRIDLDDVPRRADINGSDSTIDYSRAVNNIRAQCARNENPPEPEPVRTTSVHRMRDNFFNSRKISLTCHSIRSPAVDATQAKSTAERHLLDPNRKTSGRLRSPLPSPIPSPVSSPVPSPSRSRFQVSRVIESSTSPITPPPSNSCSPTSFSTSSISRFRVTVVEPSKSIVQSSTITSSSAPAIISAAATAANLKTESKLTKEKLGISIKAEAAPIQIPTYPVPPAKSASEPIVHSMSASFDSPDLEVKRYMDDSCSSISSIESIDRHQDFNTSNSSIDSFGLIINDAVKSPIVTANPSEIPSSKPIKLSKYPTPIDSSLGSTKLHDSLSSLEASTCSTDSLDSSSQQDAPMSAPASSNEGTLTNSPSNVCFCSKSDESESPAKKDPEKRVRKTSWIPNPMVAMSKGDSSGYPATLDKLLSLFQHPGNFFARSSINTDSNVKKETSATTENKPPSRKESPMGGLFAWANRKENPDDAEPVKILTTEVIPQPTRPVKSPLQSNVSPENTVSAPPVAVDCISGKLKQEMKENISPEHTITATSIMNIKSQSTHQPSVQIVSIPIDKVHFEVGGDDDEEDDKESLELRRLNTIESLASGSVLQLDDTNENGTCPAISTIGSTVSMSKATSTTSTSPGLGQIARDSLSILRATSTNSQDSMRSLESLAEIDTTTTGICSDAQPLQ